MTKEQLPEHGLADLARQEMQDKLEDGGNPDEVRELYDVPTETAGELAEDADQRG